MYTFYIQTIVVLLLINSISDVKCMFYYCKPFDHFDNIFVIL